LHSDVDLSGAEYEALRCDASAAFADALRQHQQLPRRAFKTFASILANCIKTAGVEDAAHGTAAAAAVAAVAANATVSAAIAAATVTAVTTATAAAAAAAGSGGGGGGAATASASASRDFKRIERARNRKIARKLAPKRLQDTNAERAAATVAALRWTQAVAQAAAGPHAAALAHNIPIPPHYEERDGRDIAHVVLALYAAYDEFDAWRELFTGRDARALL
jgi:hypothetical protein